MDTNFQSETYNRLESAAFRKTKEQFGQLSNMAAGYPLHINGIRILTSEALYQACRFPHMPEIQQLIIDQASPMTAKMKSKPYRQKSREDWIKVRIPVMLWCLRVKLAQNWDKFYRVLLETRNLDIVEDSRKDDFWGAKPQGETALTGRNVLGKLLMQLRQELQECDKKNYYNNLQVVEPLNIDQFLLLGAQIDTVTSDLRTGRPPKRGHHQTGTLSSLPSSSSGQK